MIVKKFRFTGNTVFTSERLTQELQSYVGRPLTVDDLENARLRLTRFYIERGYVNSGAVLPDQGIRDGEVAFELIEGKLSEVPLHFLDGANHETSRHLLRQQYIHARIWHATSGPLNVNKLNEELELIRQNPNVTSVNAELKPGSTAGQAVLDVGIREANPFEIGLQFSNRRPPSVGEAAYDLLVSDRDLTGNSDDLEVRYDIANGALDDSRFAGTDDLSIDYVLPISPSDTSLGFNYSRTSTLVVESAIQSLHVNSESNNYAITLRQPLYRRPVAEPGHPAAEVAVFVSGAYRDNLTRLDGQDFSFSPGADSGTTRVTVISVGQDFTLRNLNDALSARSTFNFGVPWLGATKDRGDAAGGTFFSWLAQAQLVHVIPQVGPWKTNGWQLIARASGQIANRPLVTLEQFVIGGVDTVRGYPENELVTDDGIVGSLEMHIPLIQRQNRDLLQLVPFTDVGYGTNDRSPHHSKHLNSVGLGFLFNPCKNVDAYLFYGIPLNTFERTHNNAQDYGFHFGLTIFAF